MQRWLVLLLLLLASLARSEPRTVPLYVYHDFPPYLVAGLPDLSEALIRILNREAAGRYHFELTVLPRRRVDALIAKANWEGVVAWVNPQWIGNNARHLAWSPPLIDEIEWWVVRDALPLTQAQIEQGRGYRFGGLLGHRYVELDAAVRAGGLTRFDTASMQSLAHMLLAGRVDVITMPDSTEQWFADRWPAWRGATHLVSRNSAYQRFLLSNAADAQLTHFLAEAVPAIRADPAWPQPLAPADTHR
ncbi:hypothetical protein [Chitinolyticbacter albus]|uniref:hypothetical protein n=1 Tax=Chitinolyticbacter albus TaxID=2961951 RepID=UPI00210A988C|nr:hypothetical protein [Chitinolyticbacter albus]